MVGLFLTVLSSGLVFAAGFSKGNQYESQRLSGTVTVYCNPGGGGGGFDSAYYGCDANYLSPAEFDYFVSDSDVDANEITLKSRVNGKNIKQTRKYDKRKSRSQERFNLWIWSLTQKPLLQEGENKISYVMKKSGKVVESGDFNVMVNALPPRQCRHRTMHGMDESDCRTRSQYICDQYFRLENYCE